MAASPPRSIQIMEHSGTSHLSVVVKWTQIKYRLQQRQRTHGTVAW